MKEYKSSDTELTASWVEINFGSGGQCTNCNHVESMEYQQRSVWLGKYCQNCGAKMTNPHRLIKEYDYDD